MRAFAAELLKVETRKGLVTIVAMNFETNFRRCGAIDVSTLRVCIEQQSEEAWHEDQFRQNKYHVHRDTQTIYLQFDEDFRHIGNTRLQKYEEFSAALEPLIAKVSGLFGFQGWLVRCILTRLRGYGRIGFHSDQGFSLAHTHRFHIPIITNDEVEFTVGDETVHMNVGEIWEINNRRLHGVINNGFSARVHVILDWAEPMTQAELREYRMERQQHHKRIEMGISQKYD